MKTILVDVDTQIDFMAPEGSLYVPASPSVVPDIRKILQQADLRGVPILGSVDSHGYDSWEFQDNGGPFPTHCVKGQPGWTRFHHDLPARTRFVAMQEPVDGTVSTLAGESSHAAGNRTLSAADLASEAIDGVGIYFEKEVYSLFSNPVAEIIIETLVDRLGGRDAVQFDVIGYCTGGYCVDEAAFGLAERGYRVRVLGYATAAIGGTDGLARSKAALTERGIQWIPHEALEETAS